MFWIFTISLIFLGGCNLIKQTDDVELSWWNNWSWITNQLISEQSWYVSENTDNSQNNWYKTYKDNKINFSILYDDSWYLEIEDKTPIRDGIGKTLVFSKKWYKINIIAYPEKHECWSEQFISDISIFKNIQINGVNMLRDSQAYSLEGIGPWVTDNPVFIDFHTEWGLGCLMLEDKFFTFWYVLPVSDDDFKNWEYNKWILAEMDSIVSSLTW